MKEGLESLNSQCRDDGELNILLRCNKAVLVRSIVSCRFKHLMGRIVCDPKLMTRVRYKNPENLNAIKSFKTMRSLSYVDEPRCITEQFIPAKRSCPPFFKLEG